MFENLRRSGLSLEEELQRMLVLEGRLYRRIGFKVVKVGNGAAELDFPLSEEISRRGGMVHGGVIMYALDDVGGLAVMSMNTGIDQFTMQLSVSFMKPLSNGPFRATGKVIRMGTSTAVAEGEVRDASDNLCAKGLGTWFIVRNRKNG